MDPIRSLIQGPLNKNENNLTIKDILTNNTWNLNKVSFQFPESIKDIILTNPLKLIQPCTNSYSWKVDNNGRFSAKSTYNTISLLENPITESNNLPNLSWLRKIHTLPKIKNFL